MNDSDKVPAADRCPYDAWATIAIAASPGRGSRPSRPAHWRVQRYRCAMRRGHAGAHQAPAKGGPK